MTMEPWRKEIMNVRYIYNFIVIDHRYSDHIALDSLNEFGRNGWELISVTRSGFESYAYFKRLLDQ